MAGALIYIGCLLTFLLLSTASFSQVDISKKWDISKTWDGAQVYVPGNWFTKAVNTVEVTQPMPVVIFMHGCGGIDQDTRQWAGFLKDNGYIVLLPDSYAMPDRVRNCDPRTSTTNLGKVPVNDLRPAEADYAMSKIKEVSWADKRNIFLMGHSEGGMAAYLTPEVGFKGIIISGFACRIWGGVRAKSDTPVLALNWERDPWFVKPSQEYKTCADTPLWQKRSQAVEVILPGQGHSTVSEQAARDSVIKFLKRNID